MRSHRCSGLSAFVLALLSACGGRSQTHHGDAGVSSGGRAGGTGTTASGGIRSIDYQVGNGGAGVSAADAAAPPGSCKVFGSIYESGTTDIPVPMSCNTCTCEEGHVECTENEGCAPTCPDGSAFFDDCAHCGANGCELPEYECFPKCDHGCHNGDALCVEGLCLPWLMLCAIGVGGG